IWYSPGRRDPALEADKRVFATVYDGYGHVQLGQLDGPVRGIRHRPHLGETAMVRSLSLVVTVDDLLRIAADPRLVEAVKAGYPLAGDELLDRFLPASRGLHLPVPHRFWVVHDEIAVRCRIDGGHAQDDLRVGDRDLLGDHAPQRLADDMHLIQAQVLDQVAGVGRHVGQLEVG